MSETKEELTQSTIEYETLNNKLKELPEEELNIVAGGIEMKPAIGLDLGLTNSNDPDNKNIK